MLGIATLHLFFRPALGSLQLFAALCLNGGFRPLVSIGTVAAKVRFARTPGAYSGAKLIIFAPLVVSPIFLTYLDVHKSGA